MNNNKKQRNKKLKKINKIDILIFLLVFLIFVIALLSFFPGLLTSDNVDQINQAENNFYYQAHPIIHSFIIGNLTKLGGIWVPALFQIIMFASIWTYICKVLRKYNNSKANILFQIIFTIIVCIMPLNFLYSITLWKDIIYSYSILLILVFIFIGIKEKYKFTTMQIFLISLSSVAIIKFRRNGLPVGLFVFVVLLFLNFIKNKKIKDILKFVVSFFIIWIIMSIPQWVVNQRDSSAGGSVLNSTKVYCFGKLLNEGIELTEEEEEFLNTILDLDEWKENFDPYTGTPILFSQNLNNSILTDKDNEKKFDEIFFKYAKQNKKAVFEHFCNINSIWWSVKELGGMHSVILNNGSVSEMSNGKYDNEPILKKMNVTLTNFTIKTLEKSFIYKILYRPATALYISIILVLIICFKKRKIGYILIIFPMLINIATYVFLISSQDQRYFYPCFMTEYFMILVTATTFIKKNDKYKKKCNEINNENTKVLVIVPAYNEEKSIEKVINSIYEQNIKNCDVIVINDGSKDNTYLEAIKTKATVINSPNNLGIGGAVQTGYIYAKKNNYDIAIQTDGDGQHNPKYINDLIEQIKEGYDLVIGSRFIERTNYNQTFFRMLGINIISGIIKMMTNEKIYDTTSGFRAVNKNIIDEFAEDYPYDYPEPCTNMNMIKKGYKVKEIPVEMNNRENGVSSISQIKSIGYMLKVTLFLIIKGIVD